MKIKVNSTFNFCDGTLYTFINPFSFRVLLSAPDRTAIFENFVIYPDGISLSKVLSIFKKKVERTSFDDTSIAPTVFKLISNKNLSLGIIGSSEQTITTAKHIINKKYLINNIKCHSGYFSEEEKLGVLNSLLNCDIVISSMGTPRQETILMELKALGWKGTGFTCGGYFDQLTSVNGSKYYPLLIDNLNLRWAYRIFKEPKRLWRRYLVDYPVGIVLFIRHIRNIRIAPDHRTPGITRQHNS
ncbi:UDP-Gal:alpha-D-GlcNAc-diphosphoundecaprenol beta-1,4-galactosyltransferase [compost metagenome]